MGLYHIFGKKKVGENICTGIFYSKCVCIISVPWFFGPELSNSNSKGGFGRVGDFGSYFTQAMASQGWGRPAKIPCPDSGPMNHTFEVADLDEGKGLEKPLVDPILAYLFDLSIYLAVYYIIVNFSPGILCHSYLCFLVCLVFAFYIFDMSKSPIYWSIYMCTYVFVKLLTGWLIYLSVWWVVCLLACFFVSLLVKFRFRLVNYSTAALFDLLIEDVYSGGGGVPKINLCSHAVRLCRQNLI